MLENSSSDTYQKGIEFPLFPSEEIQQTFVGSSFSVALREASIFYKYFKDVSKKDGMPIKTQSKVLDFGCGWGRFLRFIWKDVDLNNIYGCDTNKLIVDVCKSTKVPGRIDLTDPAGTLPYPDFFFDNIMSYSVFTHLSECVHLNSLRELARVSKPGAVLCLTIQPYRFFDYISSLSEFSDNPWHQLLSSHKSKIPMYKQIYENGEFVFLETNKGHEKIYGDAIIPAVCFENMWTKYFNILSIIDNPKKFLQTVVVLRRNSAALEIL